MANCKIVDPRPSQVPFPTPEQLQCMIDAYLTYLENLADCLDNPPSEACCDAAGHVYRSDHLGCFYG